MVNHVEIKNIAFEIIAKHGLTAIALGFLGYLILLHVQIQQQDMAYWRTTIASIEIARKIDADRFFEKMRQIDEHLIRVELHCSGKFSAQKDE